MTALFVQSNYNTQSGTAYPLAIDADIAVMARVAAAFLVQPQATPNMTVQVLSGSLFSLATAADLEVAAQNSATLSAPVSHPRNDLVYIDQKTGVMGVQTGIEAPSPADPQVPPGKLTIARLAMTVGMSTIPSTVITDLRNLQPLGMGVIAGVDEGPAPYQIPAAAPLRAGAFRDVIDTTAGSYAAGDTGKAVVLDGSGKLPSGLDGSQLANLTVPGLVFIGRTTASSQASLTIQIPATYEEYEVHFVGIIPATSGSDLWMRVSTNGGASFDSGATSYINGLAGVIAPSGTGNNAFSTAAQALMNGTSGGGHVYNGSGSSGLDGVLRLYNPASLANVKFKVHTAAQSASTPTFINTDGMVVWTPSSFGAVNALQFLFSSGNISNGDFILYGVRKT